MTNIPAIDYRLYEELADTHGTPLYVYDLDLVTKRYQELYAVIDWPEFQVLYAMKANFNPAIVQHMHKLGSGIDAVSLGDIELATRIGFPPTKILLTVNNITDEEMAAAFETGVLLNIGSLSRLEKFGKSYPDSRVCIRINPDVVAGAHVKIQTGGDLTKFGILLSDIPEVCRIAQRYNLQIVGLHKHTGSGIKEADKFITAVNNVLSIASLENFPHLEFLDFGGGFAVPYEPDEDRINYTEFGRAITTCLRNHCDKIGKQLALYFEPGKYLVAESGTLLVRVNTIKNNNGRLIAGTDSGFPQLIRPMFYDAYHHIENISEPEKPLQPYDICGNICETGDQFAMQRLLPHISEGDLLAIRGAGAYCYAMGGIYNLRAMPAEVVISNGQPKLARKRLAPRELIDGILKECIL